MSVFILVGFSGFPNSQTSLSPLRNFAQKANRRCWCRTESVVLNSLAALYSCRTHASLCIDSMSPSMGISRNRASGAHKLSNETEVVGCLTVGSPFRPTSPSSYRSILLEPQATRYVPQVFGYAHVIMIVTKDRPQTSSQFQAKAYKYYM